MLFFLEGVETSSKREEFSGQLKSKFGAQSKNDFELSKGGEIH
jgi:hypothetical protein